MISKNDSRKTSLPAGLGLGTMMMGWKLNNNESEKIISSAYENQILLIDTSVSYARGYCHEIIGKALLNLKLGNKFFIATKVGGISNDSDPPQNRGYSKHNIIRQCELSLTQLNIDCIDLLQLHNPTNDLELQEVLEDLNLLITQGKIKNYGICNYNIKNTKELLTHIRQNNFPEPLTTQFEYNLINFHEQSSLFDFLESTNFKTLKWGPLASGLLTDWYLGKPYLRPNSRIEAGRENNSKNTILNKISTRNLLNKFSAHCFDLNIQLKFFLCYGYLKQNPITLH